DVETVRAAEAVELRQMMTWEQAPTNPARLHRAGVEIALTTDRLERRATFFANLRRAIAHGLAPDDALAALTTVPAQLCGVADRRSRDVWAAGVRHGVEPAPAGELAGTWAVELAHGGVKVDELRFADEKKLELKAGDASVRSERLHRSARQIDVTFDAAKLGG